MKYYVYRIYNEYGDTLYIGKGSGDRLRHQIRRFGFFGEKLKEFEREKDSLKEEVRLIAEFKPPLNKTKGGERGGNGGKSGGPRINIYEELCRLIRIARKRPETAPTLLRIVHSWILKVGYEKCVVEFKKFNVFLDLVAKDDSVDFKDITWILEAKKAA